MSETQAIVLLMAVGLGYLLYDKYMVGSMEYVKSTVDDREYLVQSQPDKQQAADLLATIAANLKQFVSHMEKTAPQDPRVVLLVKHFNPEAMCEGAPNERYTSYSINKGEKIVFCLRSRDKYKKLEELNMIMFVAIHELGHLATEDVGHTPTFWANFKWLLEHAVNIGLYVKQDFEKKPREYCGMMVRSSVLD